MHILFLVHCGKALPSKEKFLNCTNVNISGEEKVTMACDSLNTDIFQIVKDTAPLIREAREKHEIVEDKNPTLDNYWKKSMRIAENYGVPIMEYLELNKISEFQERNKEFGRMLMKTVANINFTYLLKQSMIKTKRNVAEKVKNFFERILKSKGIDETTNDREQL